MSFERAEQQRFPQATPAQLAELLAYNTPIFKDVVMPPLPLPNQPGVATWERYLTEAQELGIYRYLQTRLPQLQFPIEAGISHSALYEMATRRGLFTGKADGLTLEQPDALVLEIYASPAGRIPVLTTKVRGDFVALVRALGMRNEPVALPESVGALFIRGFTNWDRVQRLRASWLAENPDATQQDWTTVLHGLPKDSYQDCLILLSDGPYSGVSAEEMGFSTEEWFRLSRRIRLTHESFHYLTYRLVGAVRDNLLDEFLADAAGIVAAQGRFRADWSLRFLGLDTYPLCRASGRIYHYLGNPPLSSGAFEILQGVIYRAALHLEQLANVADADRGESSWIAALGYSTLDQIGDLTAL